MAGMDQPCNHIAAAMHRIEAAVRNGLTNPSCTSTANQLLPNHKDFQPMKVKDMKIFLSEGRKNDHLRRHQRKNIIPLVNKGI